jgi:hypothetical protein
MKKRVFYSDTHFGFSLSKHAAMWLAGRGLDEAVEFLAGEVDDWSSDTFYPYTLSRHSSLLTECIDTLGLKRASGAFSKLAFVEIEGPYRIEEYDGLERVVVPGGLKWENTDDPDTKIDVVSKNV